MEKQLAKSAKKESEKAIKELESAMADTPEEATDKTLAVLEKHGLAGVETITIRNPITKKVTEIELRRDGTPESELVLALLDTKTTREQKDFAISMHLWNRGAESASLFLDLMQYKGAHTKETRVFKSQIRFDLESIVGMFAEHLQNQALMTASILDLNLERESKAYREWLTGADDSGLGRTYLDFLFSSASVRPNPLDKLEAAMISQAIFQYDESERMLSVRKNIAEAREREKGKGIYVAVDGTPYTHDDPAMDEVVLADREATRNIEQE